MFTPKLRFFIPLLLSGLVACSGTSATDKSDAPSLADKNDSGLRMQAVSTDLDRPWGMDFLSAQHVLVAEKGGSLLQLELGSGQAQAIAGIPDSVVAGQGGLMDVLVQRQGDQVWVYLSYAVAGEGGYSTRIARGRLQGAQLEDVQLLFTAQPFYGTRRHFGSRLLIVDDYLYASVGDRAQREQAQNLQTHNGTVIRLHTDGRVPTDNPFSGRADALPEIWTYGHRNPQGMARHPDGSIWVSEHGPQGGDEINRLVAGANYGWPVITYGEEYGGGKIGVGTEKAGMEQPLKYYLPSIATTGIDFYQGDRYPGWDDSLLVAALRATHLNRVQLDGSGLGQEYRYFEDSKLRFRDVQLGPDGYVYVLTDSGGFYRVMPTAAGGG
ncbi:MAG: PQQ-dependent sugar dehydrogenase [Halieaceae bacterium]